MTDTTHIANTIREQRLARGWTMAEAADKIGHDQGAWSKWESGKRTPRPATLHQIAALFGLPADWATVQHPSTTVGSDVDARLAELVATGTRPRR